MLLAYLLTFGDILLGIFALLTYQVKEGIVPVIDVSDCVKHLSQCTGGPFPSTVSSHDREFHVIYLVFAQAVQSGKRRPSDSRRVSRQCTIQFLLLMFFSTN